MGCVGVPAAMVHPRARPGLSSSSVHRLVREYCYPVPETMCHRVDVTGDAPVEAHRRRTSCPCGHSGGMARRGPVSDRCA